MRSRLLPTLLLLAAPLAHADIYAYTDAAGVVHFTNVPTDPGYKLVLASPAEPSPVAAKAATPRGDWRKRASTYAGLIDQTAKRLALQPALLRAVIAIESAFDAHAVSRAGAQGLMQLHPATAKRYGVGDAFDPEQNVHAGARYLSDLLRRYGNDLELALAAYNAGEDAVDRHGRHIPPYRETREYVPAVLKLYRRFLQTEAS
jgi:soluble lytic murein transglycosylase-like protein